MSMPLAGKWILWTIAVISVVAVLLLPWIFSRLAGASKDEVARVVSPSGKVDAVLIEINGGATTSFGHEVYVVEHGAKPSGTPVVRLYGALRNENAYGANLVWPSPDSLTVEYLSAKSTAQNVQKRYIGTQTIHFALREGVTDSTAPGGGMLYNLQRHQ